MRVARKRTITNFAAGLVILVGTAGPERSEAQSVTPAKAEAAKAKSSKSAATSATTAPSATAAPPAEAAAPTTGGAGEARAKGSSQGIAVLVNDEPITVYEIEQRAAFLALSSGGGGQDMKAKAEQRWQKIVKDPKTNDRFKEILKENNVTTKEEAQALQMKFVKGLQQDLMEQLKREGRSAALAGNRDKAKEELIDEKLKLQEAKRLNAVATDEDTDQIITGIAERNKMTLKQFGEHMKGMGTDIGSMRSRFKAELSWREVVRRRFGHLISIADRDVDKLVATAPGGGEDDVELQLQRITLPMPAKIDQKLIAQSLAEAEGISAKFTGCKGAAGLAAGVAGAKFADLGSMKPSSIPEPTRSLLLSAADGDMLPPSVGQGGVELWAVCGRKVLKADEKKREVAEAELRGKEFEILAKKHLKDLRQDAAIEYR